MKVGARKRGKTWSYYFDIGKIDGQRKKKEKGGFRTKAEALSAGRAAALEYEQTGRIFEPSEMTVADYFDYWYINYVLVNLRGNTRRFYEKYIRVHIKPAIGEYRLKNIAPAILQEFLNQKSQEGLSKGTMSGLRGTLSTAFKKAVHPFELIKENPMTYVTLPKHFEDETEKEPPETVTIDEFDVLLERFPQGTSQYIPLQTGFHTAFRPGETCGLRWPDIDLDNETIKIDKTLIYNRETKEWYLGPPKTKTSNRTIKIGKTLVAILKEHKQWQEENKRKYGEHYIVPELYYRDRKTEKLLKGDFVCTKENGSLATTQDLYYVAKIARKMGINFTPHTLRHTHITMLLEAGREPRAVQKRSGHKTLEILMNTYFHVRPHLESQIVDTFEDLITK